MRLARHFATAFTTSRSIPVCTASKMALAPVIALSHGGGPMPLLNDPGHADISFSLTKRVPKILHLGTPQQPRAIVLVTAHWHTAIPTISSAKNHSLYYDYGGFPREAYQIKYPAPGSPEVALEVQQALQDAGVQSELDEERGWDHGVFVPMKLVNPSADVPIVQVSILGSEDPTAHLRMGKALRQLRSSNIAIVGSGFASLHNIGIMMRIGSSGPAVQAQFHDMAEEWHGVLTPTVIAAEEDKRWKGLEKWRSMPHNEVMHPIGGGDHFMPLLVCAGAAEDGEVGRTYADKFMGNSVLTYYWAEEEVE